MELGEIRTRVDSAGHALEAAPFVEIAGFEIEGCVLRLALTQRFKLQAERAGVWGSEAMLHTMMNAGCGFHADRPRSLGGDDGIFVLDRNFCPENVMMRRMFQGFLDRRSEDLEAILRALECTVEDLQAVRLVSNHVRLLGLLHRSSREDWLVLVDVDPTKLSLESCPHGEDRVSRVPLEVSGRARQIDARPR